MKAGVLIIYIYIYFFKGICQFSISYDNDQSFIVIQEIIGPCPQGTD
jgi:hypothetical protein